MEFNNKSIAITILCSFAIFFSIYFVFAVNVSPLTYSVNESVNSLYNITITDMNITGVNITLPSNFTFVAGTNGTNASNVVLVNFTNITGGVLIWTNTTTQFYLLNNTNTTLFWFNATASYPGTYNLSISAMNGTSTYTNASIQITVNDTSSPTASFGTNPINALNASAASVNFGMKCSDGYSVNDAELWGNFSGTWALNSTNGSMVNNTFWNVSLNLSDGRYIWGVYCNDSAALNNTDWTDTNRTLIVDTTNPSATASCTSATISTGDSLTCTCSNSDATSGVNTSTASSTPDTSASGSFTYTCSVEDYSGNSASSTFTYTISGGGGTSSGASSNFWTAGTFVIADSQFEESYTKELSKKQRIKVSVGYETHYIGVVDLSDSTATINITSDPQQVILTVGDERKVEVSGDDYYDILIKLNSIAAGKANITIQSINELVTEEQIVEEEQKQEASEGLKEIETGEDVPEESKNLNWLWILIIVVLIVGYILLKKFYINKKK